MGSKINELIAGEYNHKGAAVVYGDSVTGDTIIRTDSGDVTIQQLFEECLEHAVTSNGKEYGLWSAAKVVGFNGYEMTPTESAIEVVMRHKTKKKLFKVTTHNGHSVTVTEDHSLMVDRHGFLMEVKPTEILDSDNIITLVNLMEVDYTVILAVECLGEVDDYVYDISIRNGDPYFFGNDVLLKNTDSIYFSAYPIMHGQPEFADFSWSKEAITDLYDQIADLTNQSFPEFMRRSFNVPESRSVIKAGRELVATKGLFITKKRYAVLIYDKEGKRKDTHGKPGEIKAMGLDLKRSDTPKPVQEFLHTVLTSLLTGGEKQDMFNLIKQFRLEFASWPSWSKGTPKRVNNLTMYGNAKKNQEGLRDVFSARSTDKKKTIPGHVLASINWNNLRNIHHDTNSMPIQDGFKVIVCKLRPNPMGFTSIAYPVDQLILPDWFKELPFDDEEMSEKLITKKVENLLGCMGWDLNDARNNASFDELFSF